MSELKVAKLCATASLPVKMSKLAAGLDLKSAEQVIIPPKASKLISTGIQVKLPPGTYGRIAGRSGLALKYQVDVLGGVIDEDFRGIIGVILINHGNVNFVVNIHDRIAQLIVTKIENPTVVEVMGLDETERDSKGFGSTGI